MQLVDLHCHILPGIDDGAKNIEMSMQLLKQELNSNVAGICFTPHFYYERMTIEEFISNRRKAFSTLVDPIKHNKIQLALKTGAEVYFTPALPSLDRSGCGFAV